MSYARNRGPGGAGGWWAFIDDDETGQRGVSARLSRILRNPSRPSWPGAHRRRVRRGTSGVDVVEIRRNADRQIRWISGERVRPFPAGRVPGGGNMAAAGLAVTGFDPTLGRVNGELIGGEENDFFERLLLSAARRSGMCRGR